MIPFNPVVIEYCETTEGYAGRIPGFPGAHSQGDTIDALLDNMREVVGMLTEDDDYPPPPPES